MALDRFPIANMIKILGCKPFLTLQPGMNNAKTQLLKKFMISPIIKMVKQLCDVKIDKLPYSF